MPIRSSESGKALLSACLSGDAPAAIRLLSLGADPLYFDAGQNADPLSAAARAGSALIVRAVLDSGLFEPGDSRLDSALKEALSRGDEPCSIALLEAGAEIGWDALSGVSILDQEEFWLRMIASGRVGSRSDHGGPAPIDILFSYCAESPRAIQACLARGASLLSDEAEDLALSIGEGGFSSSAEILLSAGFSPSVSPEISRSWRKAFPFLSAARSDRDALEGCVPSPRPSARSPRGF